MLFMLASHVKIWHLNFLIFRILIGKMYFLLFLFLNSKAYRKLIVKLIVSSKITFFVLFLTPMTHVLLTWTKSLSG